MEWFVIYLLVQAEEIRAFFEVADNIIAVGIGLICVVYIVCALNASESCGGSMSNYLDSSVGVRCRKSAVWMIGIGILCAFISSAIPSQKNMAIIVGSGIVYNAVTSQAGQRLGNKGVELLEKKIDDLLKDEQLNTQQPQKKTGTNVE